MRRFFLSFSFIVWLCLPLASQVVINEFMALNATTLQDENGEYSDWVELYNAGDEPVNLYQWCLTDNLDKPSKFRFPDIKLAPKSYLIVFLSDQEQSIAGKELHAAFKLSGSGEYLGLLDQDRVVVHEYAPTFPIQQTDISYGLFEGQASYLYEPTPGEENVLGNALLTPQFSEKGGYKNESFYLSLQVNDPTLQIRYSLDGRFPDKKHGIRYTEPILIDKNTVVCAVSQDIEIDTLYSNLVTQTYLFVQEIVAQADSIGSDYPMQWSYITDSTFYQADYGMDAQILQDYQEDLLEGFLSIPTLSIVTDPDNLFSHSDDPESGGIYIHTGKSRGNKGDGWERPASVEYYDPQREESFQINCGLRLHGGNSRNPSNSPKHSFRISFRSEYGASKLNFKIFDEKTATDRFDHLVLRAGYNFTWIKNGSPTLYPQNIIQRTHAQYIYDSFAKDVQLAMGQTATHSRFAHLFINGIYWGLYDICEKTNDDFAQAYMGGDDSEYDVIGDHNEIIDGEKDAYDLMYKTACNVGSKARDENYQKLTKDRLLDLDNYIDYMLINFYIGNRDWDNNNWRCARNRVNPGDGFRYFVWDAEDAFTDVKINRVDYTNGQPTKMLQSLKKNPEFRIRFADRVQKHLFDGGPLSEEGAAAIYENLADEIYQAIVCESARWGDYRRKITGESDVTYTRDDFWLPRKQDLMDNFFPQRTQILLQQLKDAQLYPAVNAPVFSMDAGLYEDSISLDMSSEGTIYFTTDGKDPRVAQSGKVHSSAQVFDESLLLGEDVLIKARCQKNGEWSALVEKAYSFHIAPQPPVDALLPVEQDDTKVWYQQGALHYYLPQAAVVSVEIFDLQGHLLARLASQWKYAGQQQTPVLQLPQATYLYRLRINKEVMEGKFQLTE